MGGGNDVEQCGSDSFAVGGRAPSAGGSSKGENFRNDNGVRMELVMSHEVQQVLEMARSLTTEQRKELLLTLEQELSDSDVQPTANRLDSIRGKFAHLPGSVNEFLAQKREDMERER